MASSAPDLADDLVDELMPLGFDWERLVRAYPIPSLILAALGGFLLGRQRGPVVLAALSSFAASQVTQGVNGLLGEEIL
jgi:membrane protein DedA with SNARE-associated domain